MISDLYDSFCEAFKAYGCPVPIYLGPQYLAAHTGTTRVVMFQTSDKFGNLVPSGLTPSQTIQYVNPRPIATRRCGLGAELWATAPKQRRPEDQYRADLALLDALVNQFVCVLQQLSSGIYELEGGIAAVNNASLVRSGLGYVLSTLIDIPIIDAPWPAEQISECSKTWVHHSATAEVVISGKVDPDDPFFQPQPPFTVPTPTE